MAGAQTIAASAKTRSASHSTPISAARGAATANAAATTYNWTAGPTARRSVRATATKAAPTSTVKNTPQPAASTRAEVGIHVTLRSTSPQPGNSSHVTANSAASTRLVTSPTHAARAARRVRAVRWRRQPALGHRSRPPGPDGFGSTYGDGARQRRGWRGRPTEQLVVKHQPVTIHRRGAHHRGHVSLNVAGASTTPSPRQARFPRSAAHRAS